jgi:hypothetical protein
VGAVGETAGARERVAGVWSRRGRRWGRVALGRLCRRSGKQCHRITFTTHCPETRSTGHPRTCRCAEGVGRVARELCRRAQRVARRVGSSSPVADWAGTHTAVLGMCLAMILSATVSVRRGGWRQARRRQRSLARDLQRCPSCRWGPLKRTKDRDLVGRHLSSEQLRSNVKARHYNAGSNAHGGSEGFPQARGEAPNATVTGSSLPQIPLQPRTPAARACRLNSPLHPRHAPRAGGR